VGLGIAWIVGAVALDSSGSLPLRRDIQRSAILSELNQLLPPSGGILHTLARFDPLPSVNGPAADVPRPTKGILATGGVRGARDSIVRVIGTACGLGIEGSGWVAAPGTIVTNAHVVAGESDTTVEVGGHPPALPARTIDFDPHDDVAVLHVRGLSLRPLSLATNDSSGTPAAILGYPLDGPFRAEAGRLGHTQTVNTQDAYGNGPVQRTITSIRGLVRPGNSGGPMVDGAGNVAATVFAAITGPGHGQGGFAVPNAVVRTQLNKALSGHGTPGNGNCAG
jgi:S1-C subfamily serine protease